MAKPETLFQSALRDSLCYYYPGAFYLKIPDAVRSAQTRFIPCKPFDIVFGHRRTGFVAIETKSHIVTDAWPLDKVEPHQVDGLRGFIHAGGIGFILLQIKLGKGKKKIEYAVGFKPSTFDRMAEEYKVNIGRKSVPISDLSKWADMRIDKVRDLWPVMELMPKTDMTDDYLFSLGKAAGQG